MNLPFMRSKGEGPHVLSSRGLSVSEGLSGLGWKAVLAAGFLYTCWSLASAAAYIGAELPRGLGLNDLVKALIKALVPAALTVLALMVRKWRLSTIREMLPTKLRPSLALWIGLLWLAASAGICFLIAKYFGGYVDVTDYFLGLLIIVIWVAIVFLAVAGKSTSGLVLFILSWPALSFAGRSTSIFRYFYPQFGPLSFNLFTLPIALLFLAWLLRRVIDRTPLVRETFHPSIALFFAVGLISTVAAPSPQKAWLAFFAGVILPVATYMLLVNHLRGWDEVRRVFTAIGIGLALMVLLSNYYLLYRAPSVVGGVLSRALGLYGSSADFLSAGSYSPSIGTDLYLPLFVVFGMSPKSRREKGLWYGLVALLLVDVLLEFVRGVWLGVALGLLPVLLAHKRGWRLGLIALAAIAALLLLLPAQRELVSYRFVQGIHWEDLTREPRYQYWRAGVLMFLDHPFLGVGLGMWTTVAPGYGAIYRLKDPLTGWVTAIPVPHAHSGLIQMAAEAGSLGIAVWLLMIFSVYQGLAREIRRRPPQNNPLTLGLCGAAVVMLFSLAFGNYLLAWLYTPASFVFWLVYALIMAAHSFPNAQTELKARGSSKGSQS